VFASVHWDSVPVASVCSRLQKPFFSPNVIAFACVRLEFDYATSVYSLSVLGLTV